MKFIAPKTHLRGVQRIPHATVSREPFELMERNERTVDFPPSVMEALRQRLTPFTLRAYPEPEPLYQQLAAWLGVPREMVLLTMGADGGLKAIFEVFVEPGDEVVSVSPSFGMYPVYGQLYGAVRHEVRFNRDLSLPLAQILERINPKTKLVVLANPNQPIERVYTPSEIEILLQACAEHDALLVMDEAYHEFSPGTTAMPWLGTNGHLMVVRSFSKAFGLAGVRLGYVVSQAENIQHLQTVRPIYEVSAVAIAMGGYLLEHVDVMQAYVAEVRETMAWLTSAIQRMGFETRGQYGNAMLVAMPPALPVRPLAVSLEGQGFLIRAETEAPLTNHLRITVGPRDQAERFLEALQTVVTLDASAQGSNPSMTSSTPERHGT